MGNGGRTVWGQGKAKCLKEGRLAHLGIKKQTSSFVTPFGGSLAFSLLRTGPSSLSQQFLQYTHYCWERDRCLCYYLDFYSQTHEHWQGKKPLHLLKRQWNIYNSKTPYLSASKNKMELCSSSVTKLPLLSSCLPTISRGFSGPLVCPDCVLSCSFLRASGLTWPCPLVTKVDAVHGSGKRVLLFGSVLLTFTLASRSESRCTSKLKNCIATASRPRKPEPGSHPQAYPLPFCLLWPDGQWLLTCSWDSSLGNLELIAKPVSSVVV